MKYCILNGKVILKDQVIDANVFVNGSKITEISKRQPEDETIIDAKGRYVSPGFIDVHSHGRGGSDTMYILLLMILIQLRQLLLKQELLVFYQQQ